MAVFPCVLIGLFLAGIPPLLYSGAPLAAALLATLWGAFLYLLWRL